MFSGNLPARYIYTALTVPAFGIMYLFTALVIFAGFPFLVLRRKTAIKMFMQFWAKSIFYIIGKRIHIQGTENLKTAKHYILLANHSSLFDIVAIASVFPDLTWFGHERLLKIPVFRKVLQLTDYIPMRKATIANTKEMIRQLTARSATGNIAIFPEGTRTLDGRLNDFFRGFIILLRTTEVNALPVTLNGFYELKPKNRFHIDFSSTLGMVIHKPVPGEDLKNKSDREIAGHIKSIIESSLTGYHEGITDEIQLKPGTLGNERR